MKADEQDQFTPHNSRKRFPIVEASLGLVIIAGLLVLWFYWEESTRPAVPELDIPPPVTTPLQQPEPELPPTPDIPRVSGADSTPIQDRKLAEVPEETATTAFEEATQQESTARTLTREEGDELVRQQLATTGSQPRLDKLIANEYPLDATAAIIDGLGRGLILRKIIQSSPPSPGFSVEQRGDIYYLDPANYARYEDIATNLSSMDTQALVDNFHTLRPLYELAYRKLGLDPEDFDNSIIRALDLVLATPEIEEPIALKPRSVTYLYADPALESLPSLQKQLLRMGPDNIRLIKRQAKALREALVSG